MTATAGFFLAAKGHVYGWNLLTTLTGTASIIASGCVVNNYIDRRIDKQMARTKNRALPSGIISTRGVMIYALLLAILGFSVLALFTNWLVVLAGGVGLFFYLVPYSIFKRRTVHGTLIGAVSGAMPPVAGYLAVTNHLDTAALILFLILVFWQMPHFYSIAMYRFKDYKTVGLPVLPVKSGLWITKIQILAYVGAFTAATAMLTILGYTGYIFLIVMLITGLSWFWIGLEGLSTKDDTKWAREMFFHSLKVTMILAVMLSIGSVLT